MSSWLYPIFFLSSIASGNLQRSVTSRASFSIIKISSSPSKDAFYFYFYFSVMSFVFLPQCLLILFNKISAIFIKLYFNVAHFMPQFIYFFFFVMINKCFNTTFFSCFFCNFYNHFIHTHKKKINKIVWWLFLLNFYFNQLKLLVA